MKNNLFIIFLLYSIFYNQNLVSMTEKINIPMHQQVLLEHINSDDTRKIRKLIKNGIDLNFRIQEYTNIAGCQVPGYNMNLLHYAVKQNSNKSVLLFLTLGFDPNDNKMYGHQSALLLAIGNSVNAKNEQQRHIAKKIVKNLIRFGANPNPGSGDEINDFITPLMYACNGSHDIELVRVLIDAGCDIHKRFKTTQKCILHYNGATAFHFALRRNDKWSNTDRIKILVILLDNGANYEEVSPLHRKTPIELAIDTNDIDLYDILPKNHKTKKTPLIFKNNSFLKKIHN